MIIEKEKNRKKKKQNNKKKTLTTGDNIDIFLQFATHYFWFALATFGTTIMSCHMYHTKRGRRFDFNEDISKQFEYFVKISITIIKYYLIILYLCVVPGFIRRIYEVFHESAPLSLQIFHAIGSTLWGFGNATTYGYVSSAQRQVNKSRRLISNPTLKSKSTANRKHNNNHKDDKKAGLFNVTDGFGSGTESARTCDTLTVQNESNCKPEIVDETINTGESILAWWEQTETTLISMSSATFISILECVKGSSINESDTQENDSFLTVE